MRLLPSCLVMAGLIATAPARSQASPPSLDPVAQARCAARPGAFGCANAANLAAMARPEDLAAGRAATPAPGALEAAAVARLLADKVKDLRREGTESAGGGPQ
jgi:type IV pilus biogenesis protein CpaD/CtpE